jgi:hypothetical protein
MEEVAVTSEEWIEREYDRIVAEHGEDGATQKESRELAAQRYEDAVRCGEVERESEDLYREGLHLFDRVIRPLRNRRKTSLQNDMDTIVAALNDETILGNEDPILHVPYPMGTTDGRDKVLSMWTREDWRQSSMTRYRNAAEVTLSAQAFDERAAVISDRMLAKGAATLGDLFS